MVEPCVAGAPQDLVEVKIETLAGCHADPAAIASVNEV